MKKTILFAASALLLLASCDDMLDKEPRDKFVNSPEFWNNVNQVESYSNRFFENYVGYGQGGSYGWFYFKSLSDDQVNPDFDNWAWTSVPGNNSEWGWVGGYRPTNLAPHGTPVYYKLTITLQ